MDSPRLNLLDEPLIRIRDSDGKLQKLSLPELFVQLGRDSVRDYPALRPHQRHPWHALLVQLAALALHEAGETTPWDNARDWRTALLALTPDYPDGCAFSLVAPNDKPAFLQAPVPGGKLEGWKEIATPDALDMLVTSKNHDLKGERMARAEADDWLFALCSLQTEGSYTKAGPTEFYFGSVRMSGLQGSRSGVGVVPQGGPGKRWSRDVTMALGCRDAVTDTFGLLNTKGAKLIWCLPWTGKSPGLAVGTLDPFFIEICRLVRLDLTGTGNIQAFRKGTEVQRIAGKDLGGRIGDLWAPLDRKFSADEPSAFQIGKSGLSYSVLAELVYPHTEARFIQSPAQALLPCEGGTDVDVLVCGIARGQKGVSVGYRHRHVPVPRKAVGILRSGNGSLVARVAKERVVTIGSMRRNVLWPALIHLFDVGKTRSPNEKVPDSVKEKASDLCAVFEQAKDASFFDDLNREIELDTESTQHAQRLLWIQRLAEDAEQILRLAFERSSQCGERRYRARARALNIFYAARAEHFPQLAQRLPQHIEGQEAAS